jgi:D-psicose/D-tagatose/L-ribulose 3-epimerase
MKIGVNTMVWGVPFTQADLPLIDKVAAMGFQVIELLVADATPPFSIKDVRQRIKDAGLECSISASLTALQNICDDDPEIRRTGREFIKRIIATAAGLNARVIAGPLYTKIGRLKFLPAAVRAREWELSVGGLKEIAKSAETAGVTVALEVLNRYESDFLNVAERGVQLVRDVDSPAVGLHLDTFHMTIEEKDIGRAIRAAGKHLKHFHAAENDRGTPGTGQVQWAAVRDALKEIDYQGYVVIEAFNPDLPDLAEFVRVWRPPAASQDLLASNGRKFLDELFHS